MRFSLYAFAWTGVLAVFAPPGQAFENSAQRATLSTRVDPVVRSDPRSGQLVRTVAIRPRAIESRVIASREAAVPVPAVAVTSSSSELRTMAEEAAMALNLSPELVEAVIEVESNYNPRAISPKGALGVMQLMPGTARRFGVRDVFDPRQNIEGGVKYLKFLTDLFNDDRLAVAAYNAGEAAVQAYGNVPPYPETMNYVANVGRKYGQARRAVAARRAAQTRVEEKPKPPEYRRLAQYTDAEGRVYLTTQ